MVSETAESGPGLANARTKSRGVSIGDLRCRVDATPRPFVACAEVNALPLLADR